MTLSPVEGSDSMNCPTDYDRYVSTISASYLKVSPRFDIAMTVSPMTTSTAMQMLSVLGTARSSFSTTITAISILFWASPASALSTDALNECLSGSTTVTARYAGDTFTPATNGNGAIWQDTTDNGYSANVYGYPFYLDDELLNGHAVVKGIHERPYYIEFEPALTSSYTVFNLCKRLPSDSYGYVLTATGGSASDTDYGATPRGIFGYTGYYSG